MTEQRGNFFMSGGLMAGERGASMKRSWAYALIAALVWGGSISGASAEPPPLLPIQGYLTDNASAPLDGTHQIRFRLYDADMAGNSLFEETLDVNVADGFFTIYLGDTTPLDLAIFKDHAEVYLGIKVGTDAEASPRLQLGSTAFASLAAFCGDADTVGGLAPEDLQTRVVGTCSSNQFVQTIGDDGTVTCAAPTAETDPTITTLTNGRYCTSDGSHVVCDQVFPTEADPQVGTLNAGGACSSNGTVINCTGAAPVTTEADPEVGALTSGRWCTTDGNAVNCTQTAPLLSEADPQVGTLNVGGSCFSNGTQINCTGPIPVVTEDDPQVGTLANKEWCTSDGTTISCTTDPPVLTESDPKVGTLVNGSYCVSNGSVVNCNQSLPAETDPQVGTLASNDVPRWNGSALATGKITDNGTNVGINNTSPDRALDVTGDVEIPSANDYRYATAKTFNTYLTPARFQPLSTSYAQYWALETSGHGHMSDTDASSNAVAMMADVDLPQNATITTAQCYYEDTTTTEGIGYTLTIFMGGSIAINSNFSLYRRLQTSATVEQILTDAVSTTNAGTVTPPSSSGWSSSSIVTANSQLVDNSAYDYYMYVFWAVNNDTVSTLKFYGCKVTYTVQSIALP